MPMIAVPTAPMPVHTAYAVPSGMVLMASDSSAKLLITDTQNSAVHQRLAEGLSAIFMLEVNPTSNAPARINAIHAFMRGQ